MMRPEQFTMWLRGVLDAAVPGEPLDRVRSAMIYEKLSEVVGGQVADRLRVIREEAESVKTPYPWPQGTIASSGSPLGALTETITGVSLMHTGQSSKG